MHIVQAKYLRGLTVVVILMSTLTLVACSTAPASPPSTDRFPPEVETQMAQIVEDQMTQSLIPGVIAGVWIPGRGTWIHAAGVANLDSGELMDPTMHFRIASNTKTFTANRILQLADKDELELDDPLSKWIPDFPNGSSITIRQLLNMTSGIFSFTEDDGFNQAYTDHPLETLTPEQEVELAITHPPYFLPGQGYHYSDTNYTLLGMILEKATGNQVEEEITKNILVPLGLDETSFPTTPAMPLPFAHGYRLQNTASGTTYKDITLSDPSVPWTGGAMISTLDDLKDWVKALGKGGLLSVEMHKEQLQWVPVPGQERWNVQYGLGIFSLGGFLGHTGAIFGYNSFMGYLPSADATIIVLANLSTNDSSEAAFIFLKLAQLLFPGFPTP